MSEFTEAELREIFAPINEKLQGATNIVRRAYERGIEAACDAISQLSPITAELYFKDKGTVECRINEAGFADHICSNYGFFTEEDRVYLTLLFGTKPPISIRKE